MKHEFSKSTTIGLGHLRPIVKRARVASCFDMAGENLELQALAGQGPRVLHIEVP